MWLTGLRKQIFCAQVYKKFPFTLQKNLVNRLKFKARVIDNIQSKFCVLGPWSGHPTIT